MKPVAKNGFTLIEILLVVVLIGMMVSLVVPAFSGMLKASRLSAASAQVTGMISLARQTAIAHNHSVEVRFYQCGDPEAPGETATDPNTGKYRAFQVFEYLESGMAKPVRNVEWLPVGIIFDSNKKLSTLFDPKQKKAFSPPLDPATDLPRGIGVNYNCMAFQFSPGGSTKLGFGNWYVTLHNANDGDNLETPPPNYATVQVEAISGTVKIQRP